MKFPQKDNPSSILLTVLVKIKIKMMSYIFHKDEGKTIKKGNNTLETKGQRLI